MIRNKMRKNDGRGGNKPAPALVEMSVFDTIGQPNRLLSNGPKINLIEGDTANVIMHIVATADLTN